MRVISSDKLMFYLCYCNSCKWYFYILLSFF